MNRLLIKCMTCEVDQGFWNEAVLDQQGREVTPRTRVRARIRRITGRIVGRTNITFQHSGTDVVWPISKRAERYRGRD